MCDHMVGDSGFFYKVEYMCKLRVATRIIIHHKLHDDIQFLGYITQIASINLKISILPLEIIFIILNGDLVSKIMVIIKLS